MEISNQVPKRTRAFALPAFEAGVGVAGEVARYWLSGLLLVVVWLFVVVVVWLWLLNPLAGYTNLTSLKPTALTIIQAKPANTILSNTPTNGLASQPSSVPNPLASNSVIMTSLVKERQTVLEGDFNVIWADVTAGSGFGTEAKDIYMLRLADGKTYQVILTEELTKNFGGIVGLDGKHIIIHGTLSKGSARESGLQAMIAQAIEVDHSKNNFAPKVISGTKPYANILCKYPDITEVAQQVPYFDNLMSSSYPGLSNYWQESSYNLVDVNGSKSFGWFTLPHPRAYYQNLSFYDSLNQFALDCTRLADASVYFPAYSGINIMLDSPGTGGVGTSFWPLDLDGVNGGWPMTWLSTGGWLNQTLVAHEMGHSFGLPHSADNNGVEYNDVWDVMGQGAPFGISFQTYCLLLTDPTFGCLAQHTVSYYKDALGWIAPSKKYIAVEGTQTITLSRLAQPNRRNLF